LDTLISGEGMLTTEAHGYLERLDIAHKVPVRDGAHHFRSVDRPAQMARAGAGVSGYAAQ
jgi:hypothetical protein